MIQTMTHTNTHSDTFQPSSDGQGCGPGLTIIDTIFASTAIGATITTVVSAIIIGKC